ncbi:putative nuclease HARBI1 [Diadema antillarum]|uniref:putative nuclease HARBI1 n=1 Tax=Diadema antillarum TaxID=105358 RepID=UPI003A8ADA3C
MAVIGRPRGRQELFNRRINPFDEYNDNELIERYRFNRAGILRITDDILPAITPVTNRGFPLPPVTKVCAALQFFASGNFQLTDGDTIRISQPSVSRCIAAVSDALTARVGNYVRLPPQDDLNQNKDRFYRKAGFPGVVGLIDGTHIKIQAPHENEDQFVNRKNYHSINVQIVCDPDSKILHLNAAWPGSTHDARILRESLLGERMRHIDGYLLGDSGYPVKRWLMTPFLRPADDGQERYNTAHKTTRSAVERCIGQLKRRFHCLHDELRVTPRRACRIITACAILHNLAKDMGMPLPQRRQEEGPPQPNQIDVDNERGEGAVHRLQIVQAYFN